MGLTTASSARSESSILFMDQLPINPGRRVAAALAGAHAER